MNFIIGKHLLRRLSVVISAGVVALGLSGVASAHGAGSEHRGKGYRNGPTTFVVPHRHYSKRGVGHRHKHRGHGRAYRPARVVYVRERYAPPVEVVHVYEQRPQVVVQRAPVYNTNAQVFSRADDTINPGSLMGAAIGGLLGSQIGDGRGQLAATAAGAVGGFVIGNHVTNGYR